METKVMKKTKLAVIPAGIFEGTEPFFYNNEKWVLHNGSVMLYANSPGVVQRLVATAFLNDKRSHDYLKSKMQITSFSEGFEWWYKCVVGGLDHVPDFINEKFTPDAFNNLCTDLNCPHRGKFCSVSVGLKSHEVETIIALKKGMSIDETAKYLNCSTAGVKSRIEVIREKIGSPNMASMMTKAVELGI